MRTNLKACLRKKLPLPLLLAAGLMVWGAAGCTNREVDTAKLQSAFQTADQGIRTEVDQGIADIKAGNYSAASDVLQHVAFAGKLTKEQRLILQDSMKKVRAKIK
jgi:hypothetical protein